MWSSGKALQILRKLNVSYGRELNVRKTHSSVPNPKPEGEAIIIDAAIEAGVKRIVPSEFSSNLEAKAKNDKLPHINDKLIIREYVEKKAAAGEIEWSSINNGPFFDLGTYLSPSSHPFSPFPSF